MKFVICIFITAFSLSISAQTTSWKKLSVLDTKTNFSLLDQLNNLYMIKNGELAKVDQDGKEVARYSDKLIGETVQVDITNPMKVLLYSPDQMILTTLDSRLGVMNKKINFFEAGYEQISLVATSHSNSLWLYDPINFQLIRINSKLEEDRRSLNIGQLLRLEFYPTDLVEINNKVYLTDPKHGVFVFDVFGNYLKKIPIKSIERLVISDNRLFYVADGKFEALNLLDSSVEVVQIKLESSDSFAVNRDRIAVHSPKSIIIYQAIR